MTDKLLDALSTNRVYSMDGLAELLGEGKDILKAKLERYEMMGLIKKSGFKADDTCSSCGNKHEKCNGHCAGCHGCDAMRSNNDPDRQIYFWEVVNR